jgi:CBS domain-containing protein
MTTVRKLLESKAEALWTIPPEASVYQALEQMAERDVGALLVVEGERLVGLFSERDYARKVILKGRASRETRVSELMSRDVLYVRPDQTIDNCMALMTAKKVRHLPVLDGGRLMGIVTIGDVVKAVIIKQEVLISELENYITGGL